MDDMRSLAMTGIDRLFEIQAEALR